MAREQGDSEPVPRQIWAELRKSQAQSALGPTMPSNPSKLDPLDWCPKEGWSNSIPGLSTSFLPSLSGLSPPCRAPCYLLAGPIVPPLLALGPPHPSLPLAHSRANFGFLELSSSLELGRARASVLKWTNRCTAPISPLTNRDIEMGESKGMLKAKQRPIAKPG